MKHELPIRAQLAVLAAAATIMTGAAIAQQAMATPEVRVRATGVIKKDAGRTSAGVPIETAEVTMRVGYSDLSLDTNSGQALLRDRVHEAAKDACARIAASFGPGGILSGDANCINAAVSGAKSQVDAAIAAANSHKR